MKKKRTNYWRSGGLHLNPEEVTDFLNTKASTEEVMHIVCEMAEKALIFPSAFNSRVKVSQAK